MYESALSFQRLNLDISESALSFQRLNLEISESAFSFQRLNLEIYESAFSFQRLNLDNYESAFSFQSLILILSLHSSVGETSKCMGPFTYYVIIKGGNPQNLITTFVNGPLENFV